MPTTKRVTAKRNSPNPSPGAWKAHECPNGDWNMYADDAPSGSKLPASVPAGPHAKANALLIAAAPDMLKTLRLIQRWLPENDHEPHVQRVIWNSVRDVIAQALGRSDDTAITRHPDVCV